LRRKRLEPHAARTRETHSSRSPKAPGDQDSLRADTVKLHEALDKYRIKNTLEVYSGTHTSAVADRFQNHVMPFFSENLSERR
jgi:hypothetical protein